MYNKAREKYDRLSADAILRKSKEYNQIIKSYNSFLYSEEYFRNHSFRYAGICIHLAIQLLWKAQCFFGMLESKYVYDDLLSLLFEIQFYCDAQVQHY